MASIAMCVYIMAIPAQTAVFGQTKYAGTIEFGMTIGRFAEYADSPSSGLLGSFKDTGFILSGTIMSILEEGTDPYYSIVEFIEGEWTAENRVILHRIALLFLDPVFSDFLASKSGYPVLVLAVNPEIVAGFNEKPLLLMEVLAVRQLR